MTAKPATRTFFEVVLLPDTMVRVPKALQERFEKLDRKDSWKSFPAFVRESIRLALDKQEALDRHENS